MSFWDNEGNWDFLTADTVKCPSCGSNLIFDEKLGKMICRSCGNAYSPDTLELAYTLESKDVGSADEDEATNHEIICNSCGATVVTDENTASTFCAFCGSPALVSKRLSKKFRPDVIIPFKIPKEDAKKKFIEFSKTKKYAPKSFRSEATLSKMTGLYVPFWLVDADCHMDVTGEGRKYIGKETLDKYNVDVRYVFKVQDVPFDGSRQISDRLMEAIEPFDYSELKPFTNGYLPGFYAERFNLSVYDMSDRITRRLDNYAGEYASILCPEYDEFKVNINNSFADNFEQKYALLPVWFLNYNYNGKTYSFAVNGQTGEVDGDMPVSAGRKLWTKFTFWFLPAILVVAIITLTVLMIIFNIAAVKRALVVFALLGAAWLFYRGYTGSGKAAFDMSGNGKPGVVSKFVSKTYYSLRDSYYNLGNEINMLLDAVPGARQYFKSIPDAKIEKEESFIGRSRRDDIEGAN